MSYQFKDESALEDLLNKQLVGRRKAQLGRPSTASTAAAAVPFERPTSPQQQPPRGKLSSWLESGKQTASAAAQPAPPGGEGARRQATNQRSTSEQPADQQSPPDASDQLGAGRRNQLTNEEATFPSRRERKPQAADDSRQSIGEDAPLKIERLESELQAERNQNHLTELKYTQLIELERQKWTQLNRQLGARLEISQKELSDTIRGQQENLTKLNDDFKKNYEILSVNFERKLAEERRQFEEETKKREQLHKLELESKLRVDCNLTKLDSIQKEWQLIVETTIKQLELHFRSLETLQDKQQFQLSSTNLDLIQKTKKLSEQHEKFDEQNKRTGQLVEQLFQLLTPEKLSNLNEEAEKLVNQLGEQLNKFDLERKLVLDKQQQLELTREELSKLNEQHLQLALEENRLKLREERLSELVESNKLAESRLVEREARQLEKESQLEAKRIGLESKGEELRKQNYQQHLQRVKLTKQRDKLDQVNLELIKREEQVDRQLVEFNERSRKLSSLRVHLERELDQLKRVQNSLVCSLCLERLFSIGGGGGAKAPLAASWVFDVDRNKDKEVVDAADLFGQLLPARGCIHMVPTGGTKLAEGSRRSRRRRNDDNSKARQLAAENSYVALLSSAS